MGRATDSGGCVFCDIISGAAEATFIHEDDQVVAFLDIRPVTPGHLMVVPRPHLPALADVDPRTGSRMFNVAQTMAAALRRSDLRCEGVNLFYADGAAALQGVFHAHLHVIPRFRNDGFRIDADWGATPTRGELDRVGREIRAALSS